MKTKIFLIITAVVIGFATMAFSVPGYIHYQGMLRNAAGDLQNGSFSMTFKIYDTAPAGTGTALLTDSQTIQVSNGLYNAQIGPVTAAIFDGSNRWLEVTVDGDILAPRLKINSVAYSINTGNADYAAVAGTATTAATAANADYATLSGTASNAATVADYSVATTKISTGAVTGVKLASNINITTTGSIAAQNLAINRFFTGGTGSGFCVGTGTITSGTNNVSISNTNVTSNSIILVTAKTHNANATNEALVVYNINSPTPLQFDVGISNSLRGAPTNIDFNYLLIN
jgi:hypothetical protein